MRYDIVTRILLILSIIDFALAAPVSVQEKRQARADGVNIPKDATTVLGKRWDEETVRKMLDKYHELMMELDTSSSSSSASSVADHESTNVVLQPAPNPASEWTKPSTGLFRSSSLPDLGSTKDVQPPSSNPTSLTFVWDPSRQAFVSTPSVPYHESTNAVPVLRPAPGQNQDLWTHEMFGSESVPETVSQAGPGSQPVHTPTSTSTSSGYNSDDELVEGEKHMSVPQPSHYSWPSSPDSSPYIDTDYDYWKGLEDPSTNEFGQVHEDQVDHQSLSADSQAEDLQAAARDAAKGKAKESRHFSGTARDVVDAP